MSNKNINNILNSLVDLADLIESMQIQISEEELDSSSDDNEELEDTEQEVLDPELMKFSISLWHNQFKSCMFETIIIDIPLDVIINIKNNESDLLENKDSNEIVKFRTHVDQAINKLGGTAYVKNNWHAPKDASMFSLGYLLQVKNSKDVLHYFRCSEVINSDFDKKLTNLNFCVSLRPWIDIHPASEFRCIVVHNTLIGITPREWPKFYAHFKTDCLKIIKRLELFFEKFVKVFPEKHYIFDVVYTSTKIHLWDFGPLNESTQLHAFIWTEIKDLIENFPQYCSPVFRYLSQDLGIIPGCVYTQT